MFQNSKNLWTFQLSFICMLSKTTQVSSYWPCSQSMYSCDSCLSCCNMQGLMAAVAGTTLIHIGMLYEVSTSMMSLSVTLESTGALAGIMAFGLLTRRVTFELTVISSVVLSSVLTVCAVFFTYFPGFIAAVTIRGLASGFFLLSKSHRSNAFVQKFRKLLYYNAL